MRCNVGAWGNDRRLPLPGTLLVSMERLVRIQVSSARLILFTVGSIYIFLIETSYIIKNSVNDFCISEIIKKIN